MTAVSKILVVEDFEPFRAFLSSLLAEHAHLRVISEEADGLKAVQKAEDLRPDLILMDIGLPGLNGIEAARRISEARPASKIVFLTQETSGEVAQEALNAGGIGYVLKSRAASDLLAAIDAALHNRRFISTGLKSSGLSGDNGDAPH